MGWEHLLSPPKPSNKPQNKTPLAKLVVKSLGNWAHPCKPRRKRSQGWKTWRFQMFHLQESSACQQSEETKHEELKPDKFRLQVKHTKCLTEVLLHNHTFHRKEILVKHPRPPWTCPCQSSAPTHFMKGLLKSIPFLLQFQTQWLHIGRANDGEFASDLGMQIMLLAGPYSSWIMSSSPGEALEQTHPSSTVRAGVALQPPQPFKESFTAAWGSLGALSSAKLRHKLHKGVGNPRRKSWLRALHTAAKMLIWLPGINDNLFSSVQAHSFMGQLLLFTRNVFGGEEWLSLEIKILNSKTFIPDVSVFNFHFYFKTSEFHLSKSLRMCWNGGKLCKSVKEQAMENI